MSLSPQIRVGVVGSAGYTGGELLRLLIHHPHAELVFAHSESNGGKALSSVHTDLLGDTDLNFSNEIQEDVDLIFLCVGHGNARKFLTGNVIPDHIRLID